MTDEVVINRFEDLNKYSIQQLTQTDPSKLKGTLIEQLEAVLDKKIEEDRKTEAIQEEKKKVEVEQQIKLLHQIKSITIEIHYKLQPSQEMNILIGFKEWVHHRMKWNEGNLWRLEFNPIQESDWIGQVEYKAYYTLQNTDKKWMNGDNRILKLSDIIPKITNQSEKNGKIYTEELFEAYEYCVSEKKLTIKLKDIKCN